MLSNNKLSNMRKRLDFDIENIDVSVVNAIRRVILSEIKNVACTDVTFIKNTSALHNEYTSHRLSLLPLCFSEKEIEKFNSDKYKFVINESGKKNITTHDIRIYDDNGNLYSEQVHRQIFPACPITKNYILISKLKNDEEALHVEFRASKGIAKDNAQWSTVSTCTYFFNINEELVEKERETAVDKNKFETIDKFRLYKKNVYGEPNSFHFTIESECLMQPQEIFVQSVEILKNKLQNVLYSSKIDVIDEESNMYVIQIKNEDHTIGNLLQSSIYNEYVRMNKLVDFVGYFLSHPLENNIIIKIRFNTQVNVQEFLKEAIDKVTTILKNITTSNEKDTKKKAIKK